MQRRVQTITNHQSLANSNVQGLHIASTQISGRIGMFSNI